MKRILTVILALSALQAFAQTPEELDRDTHVRTHHVGVSQLADGRTAVTVCASTRVRAIRRAFTLSPTVRSTTWFTTTDPWFNRFPRCRTPKIFPVDSADLQPHLPVV